MRLAEPIVCELLQGPAAAVQPPANATRPPKREAVNQREAVKQSKGTGERGGGGAGHAQKRKTYTQQAPHARACAHACMHARTACS